MASNRNTSHAEIWDDSLLVNSWNEALEEYKHYHSIHVRGEKVEDILKAAERQSNGVGEEMDYEDRQNLLNGPHAKESLPEETVDHVTTFHRNESPVEDKLPGQGQASDGTPSRAPALPQNLISQVYDEGLKNLLMAWYYAGYYTGLHEGQQQGAADKHVKHEA